MRIVVALGGNALLQRGQKPDAEVQEANVRRAVEALAPLADEHELVVTHGNGPRSASWRCRAPRTRTSPRRTPSTCSVRRPRG